MSSEERSTRNTRRLQTEKAFTPKTIHKADARVVIRSVEFSCGHSVKMRGPIYSDKPCPNCRKKMIQEREKLRRALPYYLKTDIL